MPNATTHVFPYGALAVAQGEIDIATDLAVLLIDISSNPYTWNVTSQAHRYVSDVLAGSGAGPLTEVSTASTGYVRKPLLVTSANVSGTTVNLLANSPTWVNATFTAQYAFFFENVHTSDSSRMILSYWDFSANPQPVVDGPFTLSLQNSTLYQVPVG